MEARYGRVAEAKEKKWIAPNGGSCHTIGTLRNAVDSDWTEVHSSAKPAGNTWTASISPGAADASTDVNAVSERSNP